MGDENVPGVVRSIADSVTHETEIESNFVLVNEYDANSSTGFRADDEACLRNSDPIWCQEVTL